MLLGLGGSGRGLDLLRKEMKGYSDISRFMVFLFIFLLYLYMMSIFIDFIRKPSDCPTTFTFESL